MDSNEEDDDFHHNFALLLLPSSVDWSISKGNSNIAHVIPQELPEPDDLAIAHFNNPQAELLRWHYKLKHLCFGVLQTFAKMGVLLSRLAQAQVPK